MGLSTTNLATEGGSGLPKTIAPGNHTLKINSIMSIMKNCYILVVISNY